MTLDEAIKRFTDNAEYERTHGNLQGCLDFRQLAEWLSELKQLRERTKWISVYEGLPEDNYAVLVWCPERRNIYCANREKDQWWIFGAYNTVQEDVEAWMPLPESYREESEK